MSNGFSPGTLRDYCEKHCQLAEINTSGECIWRGSLNSQGLHWDYKSPTQTNRCCVVIRDLKSQPKVFYQHSQCADSVMAHDHATAEKSLINSEHQVTCPNRLLV